MSDTAAPSSEPDYKYWAFISYSHQDNLATRGDGSDDHIQWANWPRNPKFRTPGSARAHILPRIPTQLHI